VDVQFIILDISSSLRLGNRA